MGHFAEKQEIKWEPDPRIFIFHDVIPGKTKMHVKRLNLDNWVKIDETYPDQMTLRKELYKKYPEEVYVSNTDESAVACKWELFELLIDYLPKRFPDIFDLSREGFIYNKALNEYVSTERSDPECPLLRAGRLTQEDWAIIEWNEEQQGYVLTSGIVHFPMRWSLQEKFNKVIGQIHVPVKSFTKHLQPSVYSTFRNMKPDRPMWRANWSVFNDLAGPLDLFAGTPSADRNDVNKETVFGENTGRELTFRAEYQTLRKLPDTKCIVFSIRTYQRFLDDFHNGPEDDSLALIKAIENLNEDDIQYKGAEFWRVAAVKYLQSIVDSKKQKIGFSKTKWVVYAATGALAAVWVGSVLLRMAQK